MNRKRCLFVIFGFFFSSFLLWSQLSVDEIEKKMLKATRFMVEEVSNKGGYLWYYLPDFSRCWGEMEAYPSMIWMQDPGTVGMGNVFLDAWELTKDLYYLNAAEKVVSAVISGQYPEGGWNYMTDFSGEKSIRRWYDTIGKNGWRLEEFQHYYGNCTFDDNVTTSAANFLLRFHLTVPENRACQLALDKAINFILRSQYPMGGWPQRFPPMGEFRKDGAPDYSSYYTFNDGVIRENLQFLINCYIQLNDLRMEEPIRRGMSFYVLSQHPTGGWGQQYDKDLEVAGARSYEPVALLPQTTFENAMLLLQFYEYTGDEKFLLAVPKAIEWLEKNKLKECQSDNGRYTHPTFIDPETLRPIYVHRVGSNVVYGYYYCNEEAYNFPIHYHGKCHIPIQELKEEYNRVKAIPSDELKKFFLFAEKTEQEKDGLWKIFNLRRKQQWVTRKGEQVDKVLQSMDSRGRWLVKHCMTSHPYVGDGVNYDLTDEYACTFVGDETDTSPFPDTSDQEYISTKVYIQNMNILMNYISSFRAGNLNTN